MTPEAAAVAETKMEAEQAEGVSLEDVAAVTPAGPSVSQEGVVLNNQGELDVAMGAHLEGEGSVSDQSFEMAGDGHNTVHHKNLRDGNSRFRNGLRPRRRVDPLPARAQSWG